MFSVSEVLHVAFWPMLVLLIFILVISGGVLFLRHYFGTGRPDLSVYEKKQYIFDSKAEFELFKILMEHYRDRYFIFPQVHYSNLIAPRKGLSRKQWFGYFSRISQKSADFVLCDKQYVNPKLVIELDGPTHQLPNRQKRDEFVDELTKITGLKILHLKTSTMNPSFLKEEIDRILFLEPAHAAVV